jgi:hypothetical protein
MEFRKWEHCWLHSGAPSVPSHVVLAYLFENDELRALVEFQGTLQRHFYTIRRFGPGVQNQYTIRRFGPGVQNQPTERFSSIEEAEAAA